MGKLLIIALIVYLLNIPFGYWRKNVKKFSWQWVLAIHIPVGIVIALRFGAHLGFAWYTYIVLVTAFFLGQRSGAYVFERVRQVYEHISSCLVMDLYRCYNH